MNMKFQSKLGRFLRGRSEALERLYMVAPSPRRIVWKQTLAAACQRC